MRAQKSRDNKTYQKTKSVKNTDRLYKNNSRSLPFGNVSTTNTRSLILSTVYRSVVPYGYTIFFLRLFTMVEANKAVDLIQNLIIIIIFLNPMNNPVEYGFHHDKSRTHKLCPNNIE